MNNYFILQKNSMDNMENGNIDNSLSPEFHADYSEINQ